MPGGGGTCYRVSISTEVLWVFDLLHCIHLHLVGPRKEVAVQSQHLGGVAGLHLAAGVGQSREHLEEPAAAQLELQRSIDSIERICQN
jgi:hypothetical protein